MFDDGDFLATQASFGDLNQDPDDFVFSTEFFDLAAAASPPSPFASGSGGGNPSLAGATLGGGGRGLSSSLASAQPIPNVNGFGSFGEAMDFGSAAAGGLGDLGGSSNGLAGSVDALRDLGLPSAGMDGLMPTVEGTENLYVVARPQRWLLYFDPLPKREVTDSSLFAWCGAGRPRRSWRSCTKATLTTRPCSQTRRERIHDGPSLLFQCSRHVRAGGSGVCSGSERGWTFARRMLRSVGERGALRASFISALRFGTPTGSLTGGQDERLGLPVSSRRRGQTGAVR